MERILVTGGDGFLGRHIVRRLNEMSYKTRVFSRMSAHRIPPNHAPETEMVYGDIRDLQAVEKAAENADRIIHLVSNFRSGGSDKRDAHSTNVGGTINVLRVAAKLRVKQLIHCSTIGVHGNVRQIPADEETAFNPGDLYQETKLIAEEKVRQFTKENGLPVTIIRPISMIGPGDMRMLKLFRMIQKRRFVVVGDGSPYFQPAYIDDVVEGFMLCLGNPEAIGEVFIIGGDEYVPLNELFSLIAQELKVEPPRIRVPLKPVLWIASLCEGVFTPLGIEPPLHRRRVSFFQNNRAFSVEKAKKVLGYRPQVTLREAIQRTIRWYQENGYL